MKTTRPPSTPDPAVQPFMSADVFEPGYAITRI
jgi:hypothetical protein